jgi:hypothetical protein
VLSRSQCFPGGPQRLRDEGTRAKLLNLVWMTLELERIRDSAQQPPTHTILHICQEQRTLLAELGLSERSHGNNNGDSGPDLHDYLRSKNNGGAP